MSAPPSGSSGSSPSPSTPAPGYYPDPSIPNYIRYWNGSAWVPGTSRPAPVDATPENPAGGAPAPASPWPAADGSAGSGGLAGPAPDRPGGRAVDESGPMFLDEDPRAPRAEPGPAELPAQPGSGQAGPGQAAAGQAGPGQFGPGHVDPGQSGAAQAGPGQVLPGQSGAAQAGAADSGAGRAAHGQDPRGAGGPAGAARDPRQDAGQGGAPAWPSMDRPGAQLPRISWGADQARAGTQAPSQGQAQAPAQAPHASPGAPALPGQAGPAAREPQGTGPAASAAPATSPAPLPQPQPGRPGLPAQPMPHQAQPPAQAQPGQPGGAPQAAPWAAQVHDLAQPPWRPVPSDPFGASQGHDRPGGLVRRFAARVIDAVLLFAVTGAAAVPLGTSAYHHAKDKVDQAKLTGETVKVWLLDGTTGAELGAVLGVLVVAGLLLEVLPTAKWGRTPGKKLVGLQVLDIESQLPPGFGASLRRWLTRTLLDLTVVGLVGSAWCLFDRPWKQSLQDKAATTFVAGT